MSGNLIDEPGLARPTYGIEWAAEVPRLTLGSEVIADAGVFVVLPHADPHGCGPAPAVCDSGSGHTAWSGSRAVPRPPTDALMRVAPLGETQLTVTPLAASSRLSARVRPTMAAFAVA